MNSKGLASEMIAELQESIGVLQERADLKERSGD